MKGVILMKTWQYAFIVFLGGCCYGLLSTFVKLAYAAGFSMPEVTGSQFLFGAIFIWIIALFTKKQKLQFGQIFKLLISGVPFGLTGLFYYESLKTLDASLAIIFLFQFVWIGSLFEWVFYKKKPTKNKLIAIAILIVGSVLSAGFVLNGELSLPLQGTIWALLSAFTFTSFIFISGSVAKELPPVLKSAILTTGGVIVVLIFLPPAFLFNTELLTGVAPYGLFLGFFGVALPPLLFSIGMPHIGPGLGTILSSAELPVVVSMSALILREDVTLLQWLGVLLILGGIIIGNMRMSKKNVKSIQVDNQSAI